MEKTSRLKALPVKVSFGSVFYILFVIGVAVFIWAVLHRDNTQSRAQEIADHHALVISQLKSCHRGNVLREKLSKQDAVIYQVLNTVYKGAKRRAELESGEKRVLDLKNAGLYLKYRNTFPPIPLTDCEKVILGHSIKDGNPTKIKT